MFRPRVIPCLLLKDKGLVKTVKFRDPRYVGDPINAVWIFNRKRADEILLLDIVATRNGRVADLELVSKISDESFMPLTVGGGIRTVDDIHKLLNAGAEKVAINTSFVESPSFVKEAVSTFGSQSIVVAIDAKEHRKGAYEVVTHGGTRATGLGPVQVAAQAEAAGAGEILINSVDRDGTRLGYDIELVRSVSDAVRVPVIACGGAGRLEHLSQAIVEGHASAVAAGSLFVFHGSRSAVLISFPTEGELEALFDMEKRAQATPG